MTDVINLAKQQLLEPTALSELQLQTVLNGILGHAVEKADLYFQATHYESWGLEDGLIKECSYHIDRGVGIRAIAGEKVALAYSNEMVLPALIEASKVARSIACGGQSGQLRAWQKTPALHLYSAHNPLTTLSETDKIALLHQIEATAKQLDSRIVHVNASLVGAHEIILIAASDGTFAADVRPLVRCNVSVIAEQGQRRERGSAGGGGRTNYSIFLQDNLALSYAKEAVRQALLNLEAKPAPAGTMPVVLGPGWPGVLLHEAVGHGLEGDFNRKGSSAYAGRIGQQVASSLCTIVDDGTLANRRGSLNIDDEGTTTQCTTLIERGILKGYLQDKLNAQLMGTVSTGNGRRESYSCLPMPRMTNTYMLPGNHNPEEIIASVDKGIYAVNFAGGQVDITSGKFVFSMSEAYMIEKGKVTYPIKGATLIGNGPEVMNKVSMVGNDLKLDGGVGSCGKEGQTVPVGVGQPTLKIDNIVVGGVA